MKIAVIEDDKELNRLITKALTNEGYEVESFFDGESVLGEKFDLYLLDLDIPKISGIELIDLLNAPIIIISANTKGEIIDLAFKKGVVDYIKKPFIKEELLNKLKRFFPKEIKIKEYIFNPKKRLLIKNNDTILLTKDETKFLSLFINKDFATLDEIYATIEKSDNALYIFLSRLKKKTKIEFENIKGYGYKIKT
ncbi:response regulator transcription factor [Caminibacter pacificus]|jgi:DNA-binding response OmpR family regulator